MSVIVSVVVNPQNNFTLYNNIPSIFDASNFRCHNEYDENVVCCNVEIVNDPASHFH